MIDFGPTRSILRHMARILSDREIKPLSGSVILGGDKVLVNPNGIELRLGSRVRFLVASEEKGNRRWRLFEGIAG